MINQRPILSLIARMHEDGRKFLLSEMKREGLEELTTSCGDIFQVLLHGESLTLTQLAQRIRRTKSTTSVMVDKLEAQGYAEKLPSADDARASIIALTEKGRALEPVIENISEELNERMLGRLTKKEADELERLLKKALGDRPAF